MNEIEILINDYEAKRKELHAQLKEKGSKFFEPVFQKFFDSDPIIESVSWTQYTPYFNDGDECTFSSHIEYPSFNCDGDFQEYPEEWDYEEYKKHEKLWDAFLEENPILTNDEVSKIVFGDHCRIEVKRKDSGVEILTDWYSHE